MMFFGISPLRARHVLAVSLSIILLGFAALLALPAKAQEAFEPTRFSVEVVGEGPDVILIPGLSTTREVWRPHLGALEGHRIHLVQVRGFGEDAGVNAEGPIMNGLIAELARYIEANGMENPAIVGHSMGGFIAISLAADHPGLPGRIMIVDSLPWFAAIMVPPGTEPNMAQVEAQATAMRAMMLSMHGRDMPEGSNDALLSSYTIDQANLPRLRELTGDADLRVTGQLAYELMTSDMRQAIAAITVPATVVVPQNPAFGTEEATIAFYTQQYDVLPNVEFEVISPAAHFVMVDQPAAFEAALLDFLAD
ncbi:alpha/beta fold hydrolase [Aurantiacibacter sediminis]|uniref:Alpha/beta hydrolase n=1 Tax=Aurantiacibacter sediminis TaxID=2793064 RepID=A0ABS0MZD5_9SPHN|nr:alpha/beta hydrolase [Aurantiacibacter sediminis]MBH5321080.1 alpha/beta hydrolase [Aurantiacibacter sediminis]